MRKVQKNVAFRSSSLQLPYSTSNTSLLNHVLLHFLPARFPLLRPLYVVYYPAVCICMDPLFLT